MIYTSFSAHLPVLLYTMEMSWHRRTHLTYDPQWEKTYLLACAPNEGSNQLSRPHGVVTTFVFRMKNLCKLGYPKCAQRRFWSDCANAQSDQNLRWAYMLAGTFPDVSAHICVNLMITDGDTMLSANLYAQLSLLSDKSCWLISFRLNFYA